jgi:hypothetical protein
MVVVVMKRLLAVVGTRAGGWGVRVVVVMLRRRLVV